MSACRWWDFRCNLDLYTQESLLAVLTKIAEKGCFQKEQGKDTGYMHWQGRFSLKKKAVKKTAMGLFPDPPNYFEPTVKGNMNNFDYVSKDSTRVEGPWRVEPDVYIPRQLRGKMESLRPFQKTILESAGTFEERIVDLVFDPSGCCGKSTVASLSEVMGRGIDLPPVNDGKELVQTMCDICIGKGVRDPSPVFIDLPRAMRKDKLWGIYTGIEQIKKGKLYDLRHSYKEYWIDSPRVWVFTNVEPDTSMLSHDRWRVWTVDDELKLVRYGCNTATGAGAGRTGGFTVT